MCYKLNYVLYFFGILFFLCSHSHANSLTPPNEPQNNSFYVCYKTYRTHHSVAAPLSVFRKYQYLGCIITREPCYKIRVKTKFCPLPYAKNQCCPRRVLKKFGWFNNYPDALNAFYRCAYI